MFTFTKNADINDLKICYIYIRNFWSVGFGFFLQIWVIMMLFPNPLTIKVMHKFCGKP